MTKGETCSIPSWRGVIMTALLLCLISKEYTSRKRFLTSFHNPYQVGGDQAAIRPDNRSGQYVVWRGLTTGLTAGCSGK